MVGACSPVYYAGRAHVCLERQQEVAQNFNERGNEHLSGKRYREALGFYTQDVEAKADDARHVISNCVHPPPLSLHSWLIRVFRERRVCIARLRYRFQSQHPRTIKDHPRMPSAARARPARRGSGYVRTRWGGDVGFKILRVRVEEKRVEMARKVEERRERARRRKKGGWMWLLWYASLPSPSSSPSCLTLI